MKNLKKMKIFKIISIIALILVFITGFETWAAHVQNAYYIGAIISMIIFLVIGILTFSIPKGEFEGRFLYKVFNAVYLPVMVSMYLFAFNISIIFNAHGQWFSALLLVLIFTLAALAISALLYIWYYAIKSKGLRIIFYIFYFLVSGFIFYASFLVSFIGAFATNG